MIDIITLYFYNMNENILICFSVIIGFILYKIKNNNDEKQIFEDFLQNYSHRFIDEEKEFMIYIKNINKYISFRNARNKYKKFLYYKNVTKVLEIRNNNIAIEEEFMKNYLKKNYKIKQLYLT